MEDQIITKEGYEKLQRELDECIKKRREIADRIEKAKEQGDLSENAEYHEAKDAQAFNDGRALDLQALLKNLTIVESKNGQDVVGMGSVIKVKYNDKEREFKIVSFNESNPAEGKISNESPLGSSFIGKKKGDKVSVTTPNGVVEYLILKID